MSLFVYGFLVISSALSLVQITITSITTSEEFKWPNNSGIKVAIQDVHYPLGHILLVLGNSILFLRIMSFHRVIRNKLNHAVIIHRHLTIKNIYCNIKEWKYGVLLSLVPILCLLTELVAITVYIRIRTPSSLWRVYSAIMLIITFTKCIKLLSMITVSITVRSTWITKLESLKKARKTRLDPLTEDSELNEIIKLISEYRNTAKYTAKLHGIFMNWFVIQWIVFFIATVFDGSLTIQLLLIGEKSSGTWARCFTLLSDIISFIVMYTSGKILNYSHRKYRRKLKKAIIMLIYQSSVSSKGSLLLKTLPRKDKCLFTPCLFWVRVPLPNPGYVLSILVALVSFLLSTDFELHS